MNLLSICKTFATEDQALDYMIKQRWPNGVKCLGCGHGKVYNLATKGKTGKPCRLFECAECGLHFSATTGTLFHDSHLPLTKWFMAMALMVDAKKGISANQISRHLGVQYKTAWYLCHRIRKAMQELGPLGGQGQVVEIDETFLGGKTRRKTTKQDRADKVNVLGVAERGGRVRLQRVNNLKAATLRQAYDAAVSANVGKVITDGSPTYLFVVPKDKHVATEHGKELRETGTVTTKTIEGAFSLFKCGVIGSYHHLSVDHLDSYLGEFC